MRGTRLLQAAFLYFSLRAAAGWQEWPAGAGGGPPSRAGHTLSVYNNTAFVFGGRSNEELRIHDPRTYKIASTAGKLYFETYTGQHVLPCLDADGAPLDPANVTADQYAACYDVNVGTTWNDVWSYSLDCPRDGDRGCATGFAGAGWRNLAPHTPLGGCKIFQEAEECTSPHERWEHASAVLTIGGIAGIVAKSPLPGYPPPPPPPPPGGLTDLDGLLVVYGGYAQMCADYCADMWAFPVTACARGAAECVWSQFSPEPPTRTATTATGSPLGFGRTGPGARWRAASASDGTRWVVFGGHRMWHGFAPDNSAANAWSSDLKYPYGGYLDDMWLFGLTPDGLGSTLYADTMSGLGTALKSGGQPNAWSKRELVLGDPVRTRVLFNVTGAGPGGNQTGNVTGAWQQVIPRESCYTGPGSTWAQRRDIVCTIPWPRLRANAAMVLAGELLFMFGGYATPFPYPHIMGRGAGLGVGSMASDSVSSYPSLPYYLDDLWRFDWRTGNWMEVAPVSEVPLGRARHSLILAGGVLLMFGGYSKNVLLDDLWFYNLTSGAWLQKTYFPYPLFPKSCTADVVFDADLNEEVAIDPSLFIVSGEPTRGTVTDRMMGRAAATVYVPQHRRKSPGWDGCRDRADGRFDLPSGLTYLRPSQRAGHAAGFSPVTGEMVVFGGETTFIEQPNVINATWPTLVIDDMWAWRRDLCPLNCSFRGDCWYGHCYCYEGFYGIDCSNFTCPGSYCIYDTDRHVQSCQHCCTAGFNHPMEPPLTGDESPMTIYSYEAVVFAYVESQRKLECDANNAGLSHGICDGFGGCQCAPPFLSDDCSARDCPNNCSTNGWCSVEYPQSRCMCSPPFSGVDCSTQLCLNNCSYPNGVCLSGTCNCSAIASPYNSSIRWGAFTGDDCSWVQPFAAGERIGAGLAVLLVAAAAVLLAAIGALDDPGTA